MKKIKIILLCFGLFITGLTATVYILLNNTLPDAQKLESSVTIRKAVTVKKDEWGVPAIYSAALEDYFFAVGYAHAADRMFQMDLMRRTTLGRLAEIFGSKALSSDKLHRDLLLPEHCETLAAGIDADVKHYLMKYCSGVNHFIEKGPLAAEFRLLNYRPEPWRLKDVAAVYYKMALSLAGSGNELKNWQAVSAMGQAYYDDFIAENNQWLPIAVNARQTAFRNITLSAALAIEIDLTHNSVGSNSWVVSGKRSVTGKPLLANDPHLAVLFPSYFYQVYAEIPGGALSGETIPGIPYIIIGRNQAIGWALTNIATDVIDYYQLTINPDNPEQYELDGRWEDFTHVESMIQVKSGQAVNHVVRQSRFGPVLIENGDHFARHCILQYKSTVFEALHAMNTAKSMNEFIQGLTLFTAPAQHVLFADVQGNIGYYPTGAVPRRNKGAGVFPVMATKRSDQWQGFYSEEEKPILINPEKGYIVTANDPVIEKVAIPLYPTGERPSFRARRISELIQQRKKHSVDSFKEIQCDTFLPSAAFLIRVCSALPIQSKPALIVLNELKNWSMTTKSGLEPLLFYKFEHYLSKNIFADHMKRQNTEQDFFYRIYDMLDYPDYDGPEPKYSNWIDDVSTPEVEKLNDIVEKSLVNVHDDVWQADESSNKRWDNQHTLTFKHPLGSIKILAPFVNRGPYAFPGGKDCILTAGFKGAEDYRVRHLSAFRMIMDYSDYAHSVIIGASGQSGHFMSRHYDDQIPLFIKSDYRPMEPNTQGCPELMIAPGTATE